jgi:Flp pilus assembly protein TadB
VLFLAVFVAWDWAHRTPPHLSLAFKRDFIVNNHWISRGVTNFLCLSSVFGLLGLKLDSWWWYALANVLLTIVLVYLGRLWLVIRSMAARRLQTA